MSTEREDIIFGVIDLSKDQIQVSEVENVPDVLLYQASSGKIIRNTKRFGFEGVLELIEENAKLDNEL